MNEKSNIVSNRHSKLPITGILLRGLSLFPPPDVVLLDKQPGPSIGVSVNWVGWETERLVTEPQLITVHADVSVAAL